MAWQIFARGAAEHLAAEYEKNRLKEAAKKTDRSMASFIRMVLNEYFEKEEK